RNSGVMKEAVIQIRQPAADGYPIELFERSGATLTSLGPPGKMQLTDAELATFEQLLPGNTPATGLQPEGDKLYNKLHAALGKPLDHVMNGDPASIYLDFNEEAGELFRMPWEIMVWPKPGAYGSTLTWVGQRHHLCRLFKPDWNAEPSAARGPLRILIVIG